VYRIVGVGCTGGNVTLTTYKATPTLNEDRYGDDNDNDSCQ